MGGGADLFLRGCFSSKIVSLRRLTQPCGLTHTQASTMLSFKGTEVTCPVSLQGSETSLPPQAPQQTHSADFHVSVSNVLISKTH